MDKPRNAWERLVLEMGEDGAREVMRQRRQLVKRPGFMGNSKWAKKASKARWEKYAKDNQGKSAEDEV